MATFNFRDSGYQPGDFLFTHFATPFVTIADGDTHELWDWSDFQDYLRFTGDTLNYLSLGPNYDLVVSGVIQTLQFFRNETVISASGLDVDAAQFRAFWLASDTEGFLKYAMRGDDTLNGGGATGSGSGGDAQGDALTSIEHLIGSAFADVLTGNSSDNILTGRAGADALDGAGGDDLVDYSGSSAGVTINLAAGTASGGHAQGDVLTSIENLVGSAFADVLLGSGADNVFEGGAGGDVIDGEGGIDTVSYANSSGAVTVRLYDGLVGGGDAAGDIISDVENLIGSSKSDKLHGSAVANRLEGGLGNDFLYGREGDDVLIGGIGTDRLNGGDGADTFVFGAADLGIKTIQDFSTTSGDVIRLDPAQFTGFADVMSATTDVAGSAVISRGGLTITITGVTKAQLLSGDFEFATAAPLLGGGKDGALTLPPLDDGLDPLILPAGLDSKAVADPAPVVCLPGQAADRPSELDLRDLGLSDFGGRDPHRLFQVPQGLDWIV
jgi:hypothetical protein